MQIGCEYFVCLRCDGCGDSFRIYPERFSNIQDAIEFGERKANENGLGYFFEVWENADWPVLFIHYIGR
jgi:hypothetical protein